MTKVPNLQRQLKGEALGSGTTVALNLKSFSSPRVAADSR